MIRHDEENNLSSGTCYTLYLEYLGGLVPLLKGKRTSKIRPEFVIFDPQVEDYLLNSSESKSSSSSSNSASAGGGNSDTSDTDREDGCTGSPRMQRRKKRKNKYYSHISHHERQPYQRTTDQENEHEDLSYVDTLPEQIRLVEVTSNIWGTKFKIHGLATSVPANLGQVTYKTSLLHLQPRQMTLVMTELRDDFPVGPDPTFNPNLFSEDEEEPGQTDDKARSPRVPIESCPPIAPMSPRGNVLSKQKCSYLLPDQGARHIETPTTLLAKPESYDEKCSYVEINDVVSNNIDQIRPQASGSTNSGAQLNLRPNSSQNTSFIGQFMQNGGQNGGSQRHAISPICCEVSVPALQSPKNAVAPSDIIFDRPPAPTMVSYSTSDYFTGSNALQVKSGMVDHAVKSNLSVMFNINSEPQKPIVIKNTEKLVEGKKSKSESFNRELKYIDEENLGTGPSTSKKPPPPTTCLIDSMVRSCSVGFLDMVDAQLVPSDASLLMLRKEFPKRLVLVNKKPRTKRQSRLATKPLDHHLKAAEINPRLRNCGKSKSLDSSDIFPNNESVFISKKKEEDILEVEATIVSVKETKQSSIAILEEHSKNIINKTSKRDFFSSPLMRRKKADSNIISDKSKGRNNQKKINTNQYCEAGVEKNGVSLHTQALANLEKLITRLREDDSKSTPSHSPRLPRSSPSSPAPSKKGIRPQSASPIRRKLLNSPLLGRRNRKNKNQESSDDEVNASGDEIFNGTNYKDLETFQKSQLRQKLKRGKIEPNGSSCNNQIIPQRREFVMHNKAPMWNENSQVYQLDFGGRVTQESAKNFQIEFRGKQVMQFGRIDGNAYTLDFQYPFSALQAFAVALANVTQRLK